MNTLRTNPLVVMQGLRSTRKKQNLAIIAPLLLISTMYPFFHYLPEMFGDRLGWYLGLVIYWLIWGGVISTWLVGTGRIQEMIRPQKLTKKTFILVLLPLLMAVLYKFIPGMDYDRPNVWITILLLSSTVGNGFFEEVFWRGVYLCLFPKNLFFRIIWPGIWFALWHILPGSVFSDGNVSALVIGSGLMGLYLGFLAKTTGRIWWTIVMHTIGGLIMIL